MESGGRSDGGIGTVATASLDASLSSRCGFYPLLFFLLTQLFLLVVACSGAANLLCAVVHALRGKGLVG